MNTPVNHTPGPWEPRYEAEKDRVYIGSGILEIAGEVYQDDEKSPNRGRRIRLANACLIAAAPELLKACQGAKKYLEPDLVEPGATVFWNLVDAIAKALRPLDLCNECGKLTDDELCEHCYRGKVAEEEWERMNPQHCCPPRE